jgi:hypothetical protein
MRGKNAVSTEKLQLSLPETVTSVLEQLVPLGILGKTKTEIAAKIVSDWVWDNEDRLSRQGIFLKSSEEKKKS